MCGIVGVWNLDGVEIESSLLKKMSDSIKHRGPDDEGYFFFNSTNNQSSHLHGDDTISEIRGRTDYILDSNLGDLGLAFRRLSILDLSVHGHQPMQDEQKRFVITFNGEVYNYIEIRKELIDLGYSFYSETDTEVVLKAYIHWGEDCVHKFNGMWAFVIFDTLEKHAFISRDRYGIKPFYYVYIPNKLFAFASEIKALLHLVPFEANPMAIYDYYAEGVTSGREYTFFKGVSQLLPGNKITVSKGKLEINKYYRPKIEETKISIEDAIDKFRVIFEDAIELRQRADVPFGYALSGGIDSSSIVCSAAKQKNVESDITFSMIYKNRKEDESFFIDEVIKKTGFTSKNTSPTADELAKDLERFVYHQEEPFGGLSYFGEYKLRELISKNKVVVSLEGQGADEIVSGYSSVLPSYYQDLLKEFKILKLNKEIKNFNGLYKTTIQKVIKKRVSLFVKGKYILNPSWRYKHIRFDRLIKDRVENKKESYDYSSSTLNNALKELLCSSSIPEQLIRADKNSMAFSIESRFPFLDYRLVEFAQSLPYNYKIRDGISKYILREAEKDVLPEPIYNRKDKIGFAVPIQDWIDEPLWNKLMSSLNNCKIDFIDIELFKKEYSERFKIDWMFWKTMSIVLWHEVFTSHNNSFKNKNVRE